VLSWRRLLPICLTLAVALAATPLRAADADPEGGLEGLTPGSPAAGIYGSNHLMLLPDKAQLVFDYRLDGSVVERPFNDNVVLDFTRHRDDAGFDVGARLFPQSRNLELGPLSAAAVNPILLIFFQRDAVQMSNGTGGSQHYFRNAIRRALQTPDPASVHSTTIRFAGKQVAASEISLRPFVDDANRARLRELAGKTYHFIVSEAVPGGIYEVRSETPAQNGSSVLLREIYRLREVHL
jgi:hypothetical protein